MALFSLYLGLISQLKPIHSLFTKNDSNILHVFIILIQLVIERLTSCGLANQASE